MGSDGSRAIVVFRLVLERCSTANGIRSASQGQLLRQGTANAVAGPGPSSSLFARQRRPFATAVLREPATSLHSKSYDPQGDRPKAAWGPRHASSDVEYESPSDFLEESFLDPVTATAFEDGDGHIPRDTASEYHLASLVLPPRQIEPLRWPTLFAPNPNRPGDLGASENADASSLAAKEVKRHRCDTLASLVMAGDLDTARKVHDELISLHIGILRRSIYLSPAISSLDGTDSGLSRFFFWFNLVPNRPPVRPHRAFKNDYEPLIATLLERYPGLPRVIAQVLMAAAHKGVLPALIGPLSRNLAYTVKPQVVVQIAEAALETYAASATTQDRQSRSNRARKVARRAGKRVDDGWNQVVRSLYAAGWEEEAREVVQGRRWVRWTSDTNAWLFRIRTTQTAIQESKGVEDYDPLRAPVDDNLVPVKQRPHLNKWARTAWAARVGELKPKPLADLLIALEWYNKESLAQRIVRKYEAAMRTISCSSSELSKDDNSDASRPTSLSLSPYNLSLYERLSHARMIGLKRAERHADAVKFYGTYFHWLGLPDHPSKPSRIDYSTVLSNGSSGISPTSSRESADLQGKAGIAWGSDGRNGMAKWDWMIPFSAPIKARGTIPSTTGGPTTNYIRPIKLYPTTVHITTILPSLIHLLLPTLTSGGSSEAAQNFIQSFLSRMGIGTSVARPGIASPDAPDTDSPSIFITPDESQTAFANPTLPILPPRLQPTYATHSTLLRTTSHLFGPDSALSILRAMIASGVQVGVDEYNAILWSLAGRGRIDEMLDMMDGMIHGGSVTNFAGVDGAVAAAAGRESVTSDERRIGRVEAPNTKEGRQGTQRGRGRMTGQERDRERQREQQQEQARDATMMPKPDIRTFKGLVGTLERQGRVALAEEVRSLALEQLDRKTDGVQGPGQGLRQRRVGRI